MVIKNNVTGKNIYLKKIKKGIKRKLKNKIEKKKEKNLELPPFLQKKLSGIEKKADMVKL